MTAPLLSKPILPTDYVDLSVGESAIIRTNLFRHFPQLCSPNILQLNQELTTNDMAYQEPAGYKPLVELLEAKHKAKVVIFNGAKQAIAGAFYALKQVKGAKSVGLQTTHWALLPPLAKAQGLGVVFRDPNDDVSKYMCYLLLAPNNPNNWIIPYKELKALYEQFQKAGSPLVHDGAYYTHSFLPEDYELGPLGDIQIFSCSKMLGLSSARVGYAVIYNEEYYKPMVEYVEMDTVGVSIFSQKFVHSTLVEMDKLPEEAKKFEEANFSELKEAKQIVKGVSDKILEVPKDIEEQCGMFGWIKLKDKAAFEKAKIHIVGGEHFGNKEFVRLNLAIGNDKLKKCVERLNKAVEP